ncbi:MAG: hypothetical protein B9S32_09480 [Verrucomicrobia bacterium Tous-C9LFEB]|nr:MAG: hypothetical protein B9S32_09480 [Verrucomicrobia bacterium Tous-C9LFEB]
MGVLSVVPSPYQRDLFEALSRRPEVALSVFYQERQPHDSPWPEQPLAAYEKILPGFALRLGMVRSHFNWSLPLVDHFDLWIINASLTSATAQALMRGALTGKKWLFWGERLTPPGSSWKGLAQDYLANALEGATGILSIGSLARRDYERRFPALRHATIPYCTRLEDFSRIAGKRTENVDLTFLFCGQMIPRKGIDLLLSAFARLVAEGLPVKLRLVGREAGLPGLLKPFARAVQERIVYAGFCAPGALPLEFAQADVFVIPSRHDGWGVVVNQALASGLPVLASDQVGAACDYVISGENGLLFPAGDEEALYLAMKQMATHRERIRPWGEKSIFQAKTLTPEAGAEKLVQAIHQALS